MQVEDRAAIERLHYEYIDAIDTGDPDAFVDLFVPDATVAIGSTTASGHAALRELVADLRDHQGDAYQHFAANPRIDVAGDEAVARWYYQVVDVQDAAVPEGEWAMGTHEVEYVRRDGEWFIASLAAQRTYTRQL
ncbi:MAG: nuclear transport factor 2 family protein [Halanaeroarchaeum sp.]